MDARGYHPADHGYVHYVRSLGEPLSDPVVPDGFTLRHVRGPEDMELRVAAHRSAFAPSRMTVERYGKAMASPHYRSDLDWVAVSPAGEFASFCNIWLDPEAAVALLEPVGTADGYRRMGLGKAVCMGAMSAAAREGAAIAIVLSADDNPGSLALYRSLGFEEFARTRRYSKRVSQRKP
jgi:ribosomal protein S18 acetylase RimI-like enzyme